MENMSKSLQIKAVIPIERQHEAAALIHADEILDLQDLAAFLGISIVEAGRLYKDPDFLEMTHNVKLIDSKMKFDRVAHKKLQEIVENTHNKPNEVTNAINTWADLCYPNRKKSEVNVNIYSLESLMEREKNITDIAVRFPGVDEE